MQHLLLYDGVCGLCNGLVQAVIARDPVGRFHFAALQGEAAAAALRPYGRRAGDLDTVYVIADYGTPDARLLDKSTAALFILGDLEGPWRWLSALRVVPRPLRDWVYGWIARYRYRLFGKHDTCLMPTPERRSRFIDG